ncbi:hypothetical protein CONPUDRAFT_25890, partial [Coniophora puteana RWD-64-598 SS2]
KTITIISIVLQSCNERCNYLQGMVGVFLHSVNAPQRVINVLAHGGFTISSTSINASVRNLSKQIEKQIQTSGQTL